MTPREEQFAEFLKKGGSTPYFCPLNDECHVWKEFMGRSGCVFDSNAEEVISEGRNDECPIEVQKVIGSLVQE